MHVICGVESMNNRRRPIVGWIYKISHPRIKGVYIGQTVKSPAQRLKDHISEALSSRRPTRGNGALYEVIRAFGAKEFSVEALASARSLRELNKLEAEFMKKYDSKNNGLNRVNAPRGAAIRKSPVRVRLNGKTESFTSVAQACRRYEVSVSSVLYWTNRRKRSLSEAISLAKSGRIRESRKGFTCFRKHFRTYADLAKDRQLNRCKLTGREIAARVRGGMTVEQAISAKKRRRKNIIVAIDGQQLIFKNIRDAYDSLRKTHVLPAYSAVVQRIEKGETSEAAFGLVARPWKSRFSKVNQLVESQGFRLIGELKSWSQPVVLEQTKEVFASVRDFAKTFGLEYTSAAERLKKGMSPEDILRKSGHLSK
jgi:hypothetical protein